MTAALQMAMNSQNNEAKLAWTALWQLQPCLKDTTLKMLKSEPYQNLAYFDNVHFSVAKYK